MAAALLILEMLTMTNPAFAEKGWVLFQEDPLSGARTIYLSQSGIRIESKGERSVIVSKAPDWKVITYSDQKKCYFDCPANKFVNLLSRPIAVFFGLNLASLVLKPTGTGTKYGITTINYESPFAFDEKFWKRDMKAKDAHRLPRAASAICTEALKVGAPAASVLVRLYNLPALVGIPLTFSYKDQDNTSHWFLRTYSLKPVDMSTISFSQPAGYKRVATAADVVRAADNEDVLNNLF